jgi:hypothetical protein
MSHGELDKDTVGAGLLAYQLAVEQTRREWCRLESLVFLWYGQKGLDTLRQAFIDPKKQSPCGEYALLRIWARDTARNEIKGAKVSVDFGDGWRFTVSTPYTPYGPTVVRLNQSIVVEAAPTFEGLKFVEWKLAERRAFGQTYILWWLPGSTDNPWTFKAAKEDLVLIAAYGPIVEEAPPVTPEPPPELP